MSKLSDIKRIITDSDYRFMIFASKGFYKKMDDKQYLNRMFKATMGYELNLDNPKTFNEKLQWLKLYDRKPEYTKMADKFAVKKYVADIIGEEYIIPTLGVWDNPDDINFDELPDKFVLKCTHNSGLGMYICKDKTKLNISKIKRELKKGLKQQYYYMGREYPYKNVKPQIIAEKYMEDVSKKDLPDYKFLCFNGEPKIVEIHQNRFKDNYTQDFYDNDWNKTEITQGKISDEPIDKPAQFEKMIAYSIKLSKEIAHIRVDWYEINGELYFGELTFFDGSGFMPFDKKEYDYMLGKMIDLPINS